MKYDKKVELVKKDKISDGMGGWIEGQETIVQVFESFLTPVRASVMMAEHGVSTNRGMKLFTKSSILLETSKGKFDDVLVRTPDKQTYKIVEYTDFTKVKMLVLDGVVS